MKLKMQRDDLVGFRNFFKLEKMKLIQKRNRQKEHIDKKIIESEIQKKSKIIV